MATPISKRIERLRERKYESTTGRVILVSKRDSADFGADTSSLHDYLFESMQPVDEAYTRKTFAECDRVQNQLGKALTACGVAVEFDHQGSVTNDTHIRLHSDVDLLVLPTRFYHAEPPLPILYPYVGDPVAELLQIRTICHASLEAAYPKAEVNGEGSKAVSIFGGSLVRKVDVVPASWLHTVRYEESRDKMHRGINVLDAEARQLVRNFPFLHNAWIDHRDREANGNLRRLIRLVKSIRSDADIDIDVSSYHITALCFAMPLEKFTSNPESLLLNFLRFALDLLGDEQKRASLSVPNQTEKLFERLRTAQLMTLVTEATDLFTAAAA